MNKKIKNIIISIGFVTILILILLLNIIKKDTEISISERRKLAKFPKITIEGIINKTVTNNLEKYLEDQFIGRDIFIKTKYNFNEKIYRQKDNNGKYVKDDIIYKIEYPLNEKVITKNVKKLEEINQKYLQGLNKYYTIIPDKNYYSKENNLKLDYNKIEKIFEENLSNAQYIEIKNMLNINDYYKTDIHWKQENIIKIANKIKEEMNLEKQNKKYNQNKIENFYGGLISGIGKKLKPDELIYLTNEELENSVTYNYETKKQGKIYDLEKNQENKDKYDIFLSGPTPIIEIKNTNKINENKKNEKKENEKNENEKNENKKELIIFRDSFASSLAPLFVENYEKITLIDLRYINSNYIENYIKFENKDILFAYSGVVLNNLQR